MDNLITFAGGTYGRWKVEKVLAVQGDTLKATDRVDVVTGSSSRTSSQPVWTLHGFLSNPRYATRRELDQLKAIQPPLHRPEAMHAALIPIRKTAAWWELAQDERREIFEETSRHTAIGMGYLPAVARRLHHSRDLEEPFDFLTWFEFAHSDAPAFDALVHALRATPEWKYVEREVDIRLVRDGSE